MKTIKFIGLVILAGLISCDKDDTWTTNNLSCNYFPVNTFKYIGIKISEGNKERIGWIKLGVYNNINIIVLETAIQK